MWQYRWGGVWFGEARYGSLGMLGWDMSRTNGVRQYWWGVVCLGEVVPGAIWRGSRGEEGQGLEWQAKAWFGSRGKVGFGLEGLREVR